jgi:thiamine-phosphate pyrophosphorylase
MSERVLPVPMADHRLAETPAGRVAGVSARLMLVTDRHETHGRDLIEVVAAAVAGGVDLVQVRERDLPDDQLTVLLLRLRERLRSMPAGILVNGRPALARALGLGLHLAATAPRPDAPRPTCYGRAAHDEREARQALEDGVAYLVVGPVFPTSSKPGHPGAGLDLVTRVARLAARTPVFAIGGLTPDRVGPVLAAGAHGVAVRGAILAAPDPAATARAFADALRAAG